MQPIHVHGYLCSTPNQSLVYHNLIYFRCTPKAEAKPPSDPLFSDPQHSSDPSIRLSPPPQKKKQKNTFFFQSLEKKKKKNSPPFPKFHGSYGYLGPIGKASATNRVCPRGTRLSWPSNPLSPPTSLKSKRPQTQWHLRKAPPSPQSLRPKEDWEKNRPKGPPHLPNQPSPHSPSQSFRLPPQSLRSEVPSSLSVLFHSSLQWERKNPKKKFQLMPQTQSKKALR